MALSNETKSAILSALGLPELADQLISEIEDIQPSQIVQDGATEGQVMTWSDSEGKWQPADGGGGGGGSSQAFTADFGAGSTPVACLAVKNGNQVTLQITDPDGLFTDDPNGNVFYASAGTIPAGYRPTITSDFIIKVFSNDVDYVGTTHAYPDGTFDVRFGPNDDLFPSGVDAGCYNPSITYTVS